jgi:hypothetical protein
MHFLQLTPLTVSYTKVAPRDNRIMNDQHSITSNYSSADDDCQTMDISIRKSEIIVIKGRLIASDLSKSGAQNL